ncbi:MAG: GFA family protein [Gammaproteobacteria bacterium]|nr:GFA family protein [Gammaproteobacteria bacterium]
MIKGSCLCGAIEYEVEALFEKVFNCHCSQCRKSHGAAFATQAFAKGKSLKFIRGEQQLKEYSGHGGIRAFCSVCGSRLMNYAPDKSLYLSVALSSVDSEHNARAIAHANVDSKAAWHEPSKDIPSFQAMPEGALD